MLPTHRLSPKNQVTIPGKARGLLREGESVLYGRTHHMPKAGSNEAFPMLLLMSATEMARREQLIRQDPALTPVQKETLAIKLHALVEDLHLDGQNRVVLPARFVEHLGADKDVFFVATNSAVHVWHPDTFLRWSDAAAGPALDDYLFA